MPGKTDAVLSPARDFGPGENSSPSLSKENLAYICEFVLFFFFLGNLLMGPIGEEEARVSVVLIVISFAFCKSLKPQGMTNNRTEC